MQTNKTICVLLLTQLLLLQFVTPTVQAGVGKKSQVITIEVKASETAKLKELLEKQKVEATLEDGATVKGRVKEVTDGKVTVKVEQAEGVPAFAYKRGEYTLATEKLTTIKVIKYKGPRQAILATLMGIGGLALGWVITQTEFAGESYNSTYGGVVVGTTLGGAAIGYAWGRALDKREVIILMK